MENKNIRLINKNTQLLNIKNENTTNSQPDSINKNESKEDKDGK